VLARGGFLGLIFVLDMELAGWHIICSKTEIGLRFSPFKLNWTTLGWIKTRDPKVGQVCPTSWGTVNPAAGLRDIKYSYQALSEHIAGPLSSSAD
jgi:hypothetical protein